MGQKRKELEKHTDVVFDGYCNPIEIVSYSFVCNLFLALTKTSRQSGLGTRDFFTTENAENFRSQITTK